MNEIDSIPNMETEDNNTSQYSNISEYNPTDDSHYLTRPTTGNNPHIFR